MGKRRNIGGHYVETRERSSSKGRKGTIMKSWTAKTVSSPRKKSSYMFKLVMFVIILVAAGYIYFKYLR